MSIKTVEKDFIDKVSEKIKLSAEGNERFRVLNPFQFEDGDQLVIVLKREGKRWIFSDEAHTYMHLTYEIDERHLHKGECQKIILNALSMFDVEDRNGELILDVSDGHYGDALYDFIQALLKIIDVSYLSKERVRSTFIEDFRAVLHELLHKKLSYPKERVFFDWSHRKLDPQKNYRVDCRINGMPDSLFVCALANDNRARDATIALHRFREWGVPFRPLGIIKDSKAISNSVLARFGDVCQHYFIGIDESYASIAHYIDENT